MTHIPLIDPMKRTHILATIVSACVLIVGDPISASAQFSNGAVIVTVPSNNDATATPKAAPKPKAKRPTKKRRTAASRPRRTTPRRTRSTASDQLKIAILVNDDPITEYEISQRASLLAGRSGIGKRAQQNFQNLIKRPATNKRLRAILQETVQANQGRSREQILAIFEKRKKSFAVSLQRQAVSMARRSVLPGLKNKATQELIEERIKLQAAKQAKVLISKNQLDEVMTGIAKRNNLAYPAFVAQLKSQGTDINAMRTRVRAQMSWMRLINAKFGRFVDVNQKTIDESVGDGDEAAQVSLHLHRLVFKLPEKIDQRVIAQRMVDAEKVRAAFSGCTQTRTLANTAQDLAFQDMGFRVAAQVAEPTRSLLLNARDGEMAPPVATADGVALYAVCARRSGAKSFAAREAAERKLRERGTEIYGRKHLADLRREAHIEYRNR